MTRDELLAALSKLLPPQFEKVLFRARIPVANLPGEQAPQKTRAIQLIYYMEQQGDLQGLAQAIEEVGAEPHARSSEPDLPPVVPTRQMAAGREPATGSEVTRQRLLWLCESEGLGTNPQSLWTQVGPADVLRDRARDPRIFYVKHNDDVADLRENSGPPDLIAKAVAAGGNVVNGQIVARIRLSLFSEAEWLRFIRHNTGAAARRIPGALKGQIKIHEDFDELPPDIAAAFGMEP